MRKCFEHMIYWIFSGCRTHYQLRKYFFTKKLPIRLAFCQEICIVNIQNLRMSFYSAILERLQQLHISFEEISHEPTTSCEHSAVLRKKAGWNAGGSKNIVFHAKGKLYLVTTLGTKDIKARKFKKPFGTKDIRFASQEEITKIQLGTI